MKRIIVAVLLALALAGCAERPDTGYPGPSGPDQAPSEGVNFG